MNKIKIINNKFIRTIKNEKLLENLYTNVSKIQAKHFNPTFLYCSRASFYLEIINFYISKPLRGAVIDSGVSEIFTKEKL